MGGLSELPRTILSTISCKNVKFFKVLEVTYKVASRNHEFQGVETKRCIMIALWSKLAKDHFKGGEIARFLGGTDVK